MMIPKIIVIGAVTVFAIVGLAPTTGTDPPSFGVSAAEVPVEHKMRLAALPAAGRLKSGSWKVLYLCRPGLG